METRPAMVSPFGHGWWDRELRAGMRRPEMQAGVVNGWHIVYFRLPARCGCAGGDMDAGVTTVPFWAQEGGAV